MQLLLVLFIKFALGNSTIIRINNENEFIEFSNSVNSGTNYKGTTVYIDSDLSFSGKTFEPIGNDIYYFLGIFDGQGHTISDIKMNTSSHYTGLFGYSNGLTIRNVVLGSFCSVTCTFTGNENVRVGGIIGYCRSYSDVCNIENSVSMADVTFNGDTTGNYGALLIGGISGSLLTSIYPIYVKNSANYGSVTHSGIVSVWSHIGGLVGYLYGSSDPCFIYLYNCLNYGTITYNGITSGPLDLGGITSYSTHAHIENCVSAGKISTQSIPSMNHIGSIVGNAIFKTRINYCYYARDFGGYDIYGNAYLISNVTYSFGYDSTTFELSETVSVGGYTGTSLIDALKSAADYYFLRDYSKWLLNKEKKSMRFIINSRASPIIMNYQIILLPSLAGEGSLTFDGWYNDSEYTCPLESFEIAGDKTLYGRFEENTNDYTITFDTRREGIFVAPITVQFGAVVSLQVNIVKGDYVITFWETEYGDNVGLSLTMPAHNLTLYAVWKCTHIATPEDFINFSKTVNSGADNFNGITVYLDSDLSLAGKTLEPIGNYYNYFLGTFNGQGHTISDFKISSSSRYTGLFGYSEGLVIRNVVIDSSCSITSSYRGSECASIGGIIGYCEASNGECNIENSVNMAGVTFSGYYLYLGGITGGLSSSSYSSYVKNCANYGSVTHSGTSSFSYIGGLVGELYGSSSSYIYLYNCLNYGTITHSGASDYLHLGGIAGFSYSSYIENCVSAGEISTQTTPWHNYVGSIVGGVGSYMFINYCYYISELNEYDLYGYVYTTIKSVPFPARFPLRSKFSGWKREQTWQVSL